MAVVIPGASRVYRRLRELPLLGGRFRGQKLLISRRPATPFAESFRLLALNVSAMLGEAPHKGIVVVSAYPRDGRSLVAANLAIALAEQGRVLLVDGDTRTGSPLGRLLLPRRGGSDDGLPAGLREAVVATDQARVWLMAADQPTLNGAGGLRGVIEAASRSGMFTVVDSPPALASSDAFLLAQKVGRVLYVVRRRVQDMEVHRQVREHLRRLNADIIGLVLNEF